MQGIAGMIGPLIYTRLYATVLRADGPYHVLGAPYWLASALLIVALALAWRATRVLPPIVTAEAASANGP